MASIVSLPFFRRPDHTRHVGAGRALVCDQPILVLQGQYSCHFPQCVLAPRARESDPVFLERLPPSNPYASNLSEGQHTTDPWGWSKCRYVRIFSANFSRLN